MVKKFGLVWALMLAAGLIQPPAEPKQSLSQEPRPVTTIEARMEQQKSKWAPNGMKVLIIHGKRRWVNQGFPQELEKSEIVPILKEGV